MCGMNQERGQFGTKSIFTNLLDTIASETELPRKDLSVRCTRLRGGPTLGPADGKAAEVIRRLASCGDGEIAILAGHYDTLAGDHLQFDVICEESFGDITIPRVLYTWQHHGFPGCCRFGINRWVNQPDATWGDAIHTAALRARRSVAMRYSCTTLFVVKGPSYTGCERYDTMPEVYDDGEHGRTVYAVPTNIEEDES